VSEIVTRLKLLEGYKFRVEFDVDDMPSLIVDEPKPIGQGSGPNPPRLLSAAVGSCLSSSLLYCLSKAHVRVRTLETTVNTNIVKNEEGRMRVNKLVVQIRLGVEDEDKARVHRCLELFEDYCTVTPSVREGIEVKVNTELL
jgi:organic hydroperoxide reductase OsmC/OhrA